MNLQQYLKEAPKAGMKVFWSDWLKCYRCHITNDDSYVTHGDGGDILTAIANAEQNLIALASAESAKETE